MRLVPCSVPLLLNALDLAALSALITSGSSVCSGLWSRLLPPIPCETLPVAAGGDPQRKDSESKPTRRMAQCPGCPLLVFLSSKPLESLFHLCLRYNFSPENFISTLVSKWPMVQTTSCFPTCLVICRALLCCNSLRQCLFLVTPAAWKCMLCVWPENP